MKQRINKFFKNMNFKIKCIRRMIKSDGFILISAVAFDNKKHDLISHSYSLSSFDRCDFLIKVFDKYRDEYEAETEAKKVLKELNIVTDEN